MDSVWVLKAESVIRGYYTSDVFLYREKHDASHKAICLRNGMLYCMAEDGIEDVTITDGDDSWIIAESGKEFETRWEAHIERMEIN